MRGKGCERAGEGTDIGPHRTTHLRLVIDKDICTRLDQELDLGAVGGGGVKGGDDKIDQELDLEAVAAVCRLLDHTGGLMLG